MTKLIKGRTLVSSTINDISSNLYIATLGINNYEIKYKFNINENLELGLIAVTEYTKNVRCSFLHTCSDRYKRLSYTSRRRVERFFNKEVRKYPLRKALERNLVTKREVELYLKDNDNYYKYLEVLSKIFELSIILLEYNETKKVEIIRYGVEFICILKKDNIFMPVAINDDFNIDPNLVEIIQKYFIENMKIDTIELKETENLESNLQKMRDMEPSNSFNPSYDDNLYSKDRNSMIIRNLIGNTKEEEFKKEKEEFEKNKEKLHKKELELRQKEELINQFLSTMQVQRGRGKEDENATM